VAVTCGINLEYNRNLGVLLIIEQILLIAVSITNFICNRYISACPQKGTSAMPCKLANEYRRAYMSTYVYLFLISSIWAIYSCLFPIWSVWFNWQRLNTINLLVIYSQFRRFSLLGPIVHLAIFFPINPTLYSSHRAINQVSHPYKHRLIFCVF
jgi:hypothetical protein